MRSWKIAWLTVGIALSTLASTVLAAPDLSATIAARSHFFGKENVDQATGDVDKEKVIITWFSVQSYAVAARGHVFLL